MSFDKNIPGGRADVTVVKANGERESFDAEKLEHSLRRSGASKEIIDDVIIEVTPKIQNGMTTSAIYHLAFSALHRHQKKTAYRYSLRRAVSELGPTGFPFEKFVAEIFKAQGYQTKVGQIVPGYCVDHEVDVIAWDDEELLMCEAKFHNDLGMKSDVKIALYVKARFEDLGKMTYDGFGTPGRKLTEGWLITNTKFTQAAIQYGMCQNLKMVGWNFPQITNLHNMIEMTGTIPITALASLTAYEKRELITRGTVLCKQLKDSKHLLEVGVAPSRIERILQEAKEAQNIV